MRHWYFVILSLLGWFPIYGALFVIPAWCAEPARPIPEKSTWVAKASGQQDESRHPALAIDSDPATRWSSPFEDGHWLQIDLGQPANVAGARLHWERARAVTYRLLASSDAENWQTCQTIGRGHGRVDHLYFPLTTARYWRIACDRRASEWGASLREVDFVAVDRQPIITASSENNDSPAVVMDGDHETIWKGSTESPQTMLIDLRQTLDLAGVCVYWGKSYAQSTLLEASDDGDKWVRIANVGNSGSKLALVLGQKHSTRFLRLTFSHPDDQRVPIEIREIELRGPEEAFSEPSVCPCTSQYVRTKTGDCQLRAQGHDSRIDLAWTPIAEQKTLGYQIYRSDSPTGPFEKISRVAHKLPFYSDFLGENDRVYFYRVTQIDMEHHESKPSEVVSAKTQAMTDEQLLTSVQEATFRYFWDFADPVSGLARESYALHPCETCTTGGTGFGMMTIVVGAERGFVTRQQAAERLLKMVRFLEEKAQRYHGVWAHWIHGQTGETIPFAGPADNGGDLVETAFLVQGMLTARQYFDRDDTVENELRERITRLWDEVEWDWYLREPGNKRLYWHWSPDHQWKLNHQFTGFNECLITYLLAIASPAHAIPADCYYEGWVGDPKRYANGKKYYGFRKPVGREGGPLFFTHYSFLGLNPKDFTDRFCNYFENNRNATLINRAYCIANPGKHQGYGELFWGLTASQNPDGYKAHGPAIKRDDGTITPTAAISGMPYTPQESIATLRHFYHEYGRRLWGPMGFYDAINLNRDWVAPGYLAIDQGTIVPMIENYRTELCWKLFMSNPEIGPMLKSLRAIGSRR